VQGRIAADGSTDLCRLPQSVVGKDRSRGPAPVSRSLVRATPMAAQIPRSNESGAVRENGYPRACSRNSRARKLEQLRLSLTSFSSSRVAEPNPAGRYPWLRRANCRKGFTNLWAKSRSTLSPGSARTASTSWVSSTPCSISPRTRSSPSRPRSPSLYPLVSVTSNASPRCCSIWSATPSRSPMPASCASLRLETTATLL
jgi:hypothetical protein